MSIVMIDASVPAQWHFYAAAKDIRQTLRSMELLWDDFPGCREIEEEFNEALTRDGRVADDENVFVMLECSVALHFLSVLLGSPVSESEQQLADDILDGSSA